MTDMPQPSPRPDQGDSTPTIDPLKQQMLMQRLRDEQSIGAAIAAGSGVGLVVAILWAALAVWTNYQLGILAVGIGFLVGWVVQKTGKGIDQVFGITGGLIALLSCLIGNLFMVCAFVAEEYGQSVFDVLMNLSFEQAVAWMSASFSVIDLLFYGFAAYYGYKNSFRPITAEEIASIRRV